MLRLQADSTDRTADARPLIRIYPPILTGEQSQQLRDARDIARERLQRLAPDLNYGLIHADLVPGNVLWHPGDVQQQLCVSRLDQSACERSRDSGALPALYGSRASVGKSTPPLQRMTSSSNLRRTRQR